MAGKPSSAHSPATSNRNNQNRDGDGNLLRNRILLGLPRKECEAVLSKLTPVDLQLHYLIQEEGRAIDYCYFPNTMMGSVLNIMDDGKSVEVGLIGWEGFIGLPAIAGLRTSASRIVVQAVGTSFRVSIGDMLAMVRKYPRLATALMRYSQEATMEVTQIAACNRLHGVDERLARWLLMSQDRIRLDDLPLTQDFLAQMLGTRRASVSVAAGILQRAGLIHYGRGHVSILNRKGLEKACCECYGVIERHLAKWRKESQ